jgi:hypothetical protein
MKLYKLIPIALVSGLLFMGLLACEKQGPAEQAGEAIDDAASNAADATQDAVDTVKEKMDKE